MSFVSYRCCSVTTPDVNTVSLEASDESLLPLFVEAAHSHVRIYSIHPSLNFANTRSQNSKAMLTIGGWTGSQYFSSAVATADNRTAFVSTMMNLVQQYNLDGLDFEYVTLPMSDSALAHHLRSWEYPNKQGAGCNVINSADTANFLSFLQELRGKAPNITLSAAASIVPFNGPDATPSNDVSEFAKVLDYVAIMNYDVWGLWSNAVGPNAPLNDTCAPSTDQQGSAVSAVMAWTAAGFPANQLVLGLASYGHSFLVTDNDAFANSGNTTEASSTVEALPAGTTPIAAYPEFNKNVQPFGDSWDVDSPAGVDQCGNPSPGGPSGIFNFVGMIDQGILDQNGSVVANKGFGFRFDSCSQTASLIFCHPVSMF